MKTFIPKTYDIFSGTHGVPVSVLKKKLNLQDVMVTSDPARGVLITGESLVLQRVTRMRAGGYACVASNLEGDTQSNVVQLRVKCECQNKRTASSKSTMSNRRTLNKLPTELRRRNFVK